MVNIDPKYTRIWYYSSLFVLHVRYLENEGEIPSGLRLSLTSGQGQNDETRATEKEEEKNEIYLVVLVRRLHLQRARSR